MNVLTLFGFRFSEGRLLDLAERYKIKDGYTPSGRWRDFCSDVETATQLVDAAISRANVITNPRAQKQIISSMTSLFNQNSVVQDIELQSWRIFTCGNMRVRMLNKSRT
jgi:hypothetical protein